MDTKILITGGNGYIGKALYNNLKTTYNVTALSRKELDVADLKQVKTFFENKYFDIVIHCAVEGGLRLEPETPLTLDNNLKMYYNLLEYKDNFNKFFYFGSGAEKQNTFYGLSKKVINESIQNKNNFYNIRIFAVFDENELKSRFIKTNINSYISNQSIKIFQNKYMDFFYMDDLITLVKYCVENTNLPKEINCSYDHSPTLYDVSQIINSLNHYKVNIDVENWDMAPPFNGKFTDLGLKFIGLEQGIKDVYNKLKNEY
jgi:nucleoside-diphosphate-sugar epimerase